MRNLKLTLSYDGTDFNGWQTQPGYRTVEEALETAISQVTGEEGIRVNAVRPGVIYTTIHASGGEPNRVNRVKNSVPLKRGGHPEEVARAVLWLSSDESSYTTGAFIDVSGGR